MTALAKVGQPEIFAPDIFCRWNSAAGLPVYKSTHKCDVSTPHTRATNLLNFFVPYPRHLMFSADRYVNWECWMAAHACYPMKIDVLMGDAVPATESTNYPISVYCVVVDRCDPTFPVKPISGQTSYQTPKWIKKEATTHKWSYNASKLPFSPHRFLCLIQFQFFSFIPSSCINLPVTFHPHVHGHQFGYDAAKKANDWLYAQWKISVVIIVKKSLFIASALGI